MLNSTALRRHRLTAFSLPSRRMNIDAYSQTSKYVPLIFGDVIYEAGDLIRHVYFPSSGIISLLAAVADRSTLEVGIVGREGMVGLPVFHGSEDFARSRCGAGRRRGDENEGNSLSQGMREWWFLAAAAAPLYPFAIDADVTGCCLQSLSLN